MKVLFVFLFLLLVQSQTDDGIVNYVIDGDTFVLETEIESIKVRLDGIDCPEKKQPYGREARLFLERYWGNLVGLCGVKRTYMAGFCELFGLIV